MSNCPECQIAQARLHHVYVAGCVTCDVRRVANWAKDSRLAYYAGIADAEERQAFIPAVELEHERRRRLKGAA